MSLQLGQIIEGYELVDIVDSSPTRLTYKVRNVNARRYERLHVLPPHLQDDPDRVERFTREMRVLANLSHPNIIKFYDTVLLDGQIAMTTEWFEGTTLADRLELGPLELREAVAVMRELLSALDCAHSHGILHRQVTPANIMLTPDREVKLIGFTYAKSADDFVLTRAGAVIGDFEYMAPEQVRGLATLDPRCDLYSLGAVFFAMVTARPPFHHESQFDIMQAHVNTTPQRPSQINQNLPKELDAIILKALAKLPDERYQTAPQFRYTLDSLKDGAAGIVRTVASAGPREAATIGRRVEVDGATVLAAATSRSAWPVVALVASVALLVISILLIIGLGNR